MRGQERLLGVSPDQGRVRGQERLLGGKRKRIKS